MVNVNIAVGVAECYATSTGDTVVTISNAPSVVVSKARYPRPVLRSLLRQGRSSLSAVAPDFNNLIGGLAAAY